jgi:hypothetical protein
MYHTPVRRFSPDMERRRATTRSANLPLPSSAASMIHLSDEGYSFRSAEVYSNPKVSGLPHCDGRAHGVNPIGPATVKARSDQDVLAGMEAVRR